ncbi:hypothetical protein L1999_20170 [Neobacillus drentensis]|uniref:hypothetical protein n=1 Tax=Neobacillus drentensis TaxID=220684 RepID=UPI001F46E645|nr:hypothetical protein [Neobacillus drentensis]ULT55400.1 hypothetical protein L1999_20170 [Neobacillus drentensis]
MNEDMILPEGFEMPTEVETVEDTTPTEQTEVETFEPQETFEEPEVEETGVPDPNFKLKIKYNSEEMELDADRARELAQKGMNYDKVQEKLQALETDPRLSFIEDIAKDYGMTPDEYIEAVRQQKEQARIDELVSQSISEELAQEMLENKKFREQYEAEQKAKAEEEKKNADFAEFFDYFRQANGREYVPANDQIPDNVWEAVNQGVPLKFAYMSHENQQLRSQLTALKQNKANASKAPVGSVTAHGGNEIASEDPFLAGFDSI